MRERDGSQLWLAGNWSDDQWSLNVNWDKDNDGFLKQNM